MIRLPLGALAAIAAVSFTVAFASRLASPAREEQPRAPELHVPAGAASSPVVAGPARLRSVAALPALHVPRAAPTPAATLVVAPAPPAPALDAEPPPAPVAPAPAAPAPSTPPPSQESSQRGPIFDSSG
jgi:hypothetical protein